MTQEEALEKLELEVGASQQEIEQQYQEFYNEFQMRITNAPTTHQKTLYQKKLKQLEEAFTLLSGKETETLDADLPWASPGETTTGAQGGSFQTPKKNTLSKVQALQLLGLQEPFTKGRLEDAYKAKKSNCELAIKNAFDADMANSGEKSLQKIEEAYNFLFPLAKTPLPKPPKKPKVPPKAAPTPKEAKKTNPAIWVVYVLLVLAGALFVLKPWEEKIDPQVQQQFTTLKAEANLLAKELRWQEALAKYKAANKLIQEPLLQDSIVSITKRLKVMAKVLETKAWQEAIKVNTIKSYQEYKVTFQNGLYIQKADSAISSIENYLKSEAARKKLIAEQAEAKKKALAEEERLAAEKKARYPDVNLNKTYDFSSRVSNAEFSSNSKYLALSNYNKEVTIIESSSAQIIKTLREHKTWVEQVKFSPDGKWLVTGGRDGELFLYSLPNFNFIRKFTGHWSHITDIEFSENSKMMVSSTYGSEDVVKVWEVQTGKNIASIKMEKTPWSLGVYKGFVFIGTMGSYSGLYKYTLNDLELVSRIEYSNVEYYNNYMVQVYPNDNVILSGIDLKREIKIYNTLGNQFAVFKDSDQISAFKFIPNNNFIFALGANYHKLKLFDVKNQRFVKQIKLPNNFEKSIWSFDVSKNGRYMIIGEESRAHLYRLK